MAENKCTLSNGDLLQQCEQWVHKLAKSGGKDWCLQVPVNFNRDPDMLFMELINRFKANVQQGNVWVKASEHWPEDHNKVHWRRVEDKSPLLIVGRNYQENIIAQFGRVYTSDALEWLEESASIPTSVSDKSAFLRDYKQYKENLKYLGGPSNWTQEKINSLNKVEIFETIKGFNDLINFLDSVIYACEEGAKDWEERALNAENILQAFISRHEAGLLPDRFVYEQAKKALEG